MKKPPDNGPAEADEMRREYDFSGGIRGKYAARYAGNSFTHILKS